MISATGVATKPAQRKLDPNFLRFYFIVFIFFFLVFIFNLLHFLAFVFHFTLLNINFFIIFGIFYSFFSCQRLLDTVKLSRSLRHCANSSPLPRNKSKCGRHLTVTRGHPDFCVLCGKRHSMIACPLVDPVAETEPSTSTHNPEDQRIRKPSRCNDCVVVENRAEYVDGYKITTKKTKLCSGHLPASASVNPTCLVLDTQLITPLDLDDLPVLSPEILAVLDENPFSLLDYTSPAPAPASARTVSPAVIPDTSAPAPAAITTSPPAAPVIPDTSPAPVIPVTSPAAADTSPAAADTSPAAPAADTTTSPPASPQAVAAPTSHPKPTKRRYINVRRGGYSQIHEDYQRVLTNYSANNCLHKACKQAGMGRTTFF